MQQRRLRLGDILDDYCPRERRVTNHAVVAMIDDQVKQTRCTTCDADHDYKQAKGPVLRRKKVGDAAESGAGARPVLASPAPLQPDVHAAPALTVPAGTFDPLAVADLRDDLTAAAIDRLAGDALDDPLGDGPLDDVLEDGIDDPIEDEGPVHRPLIRATLPRPEGQTPERKAPDFTMRQPTGGGRFNGNNNNSRNGQPNRGHRPVRAGQNGGGPQTRFGGPRQGAGHTGQGTANGQRPQGNRPGQAAGQRGSRPPGQNRGQRPGGGQGRKRGR